MKKIWLLFLNPTYIYISNSDCEKCFYLLVPNYTLPMGFYMNLKKIYRDKIIKLKKKLLLQPDNIKARRKLAFLLQKLEYRLESKAQYKVINWLYNKKYLNN